jgi:2,4-dienoyl-CoA reductase-like NADH-dependent reductase (Old Yellow Enzyme family)
MPSLFDPLRLRSVTLRNRFGVAPMCMYSSANGYANDWHLVHLGSRAVGGYALVMAEATAVEPRGRISPDDAGLWEDGQIDPLARITRFLKQYGAAPAIQLAHAGRKASTARPWGHPRPNVLVGPDGGGWPDDVVAPSALPFSPDYPHPRALSVDDIRAIQQQFVDAARRALAAGFELLELHAAHGYLVHQFLSPLSNTRTDAYGGSFDNRIRFVTETVAALRHALPDSAPLLVRLSCTDWAPDDAGWTLDQSVELAKRLKALGVDLLDCSSGGLIPHAKIPVSPGYQVPFAARLRRDAALPTAAVGLITDPHQAAAILAQHQADLIFTARQALRDPYFPLHAARTLGHPEAISLPPQYLRA